MEHMKAARKKKPCGRKPGAIWRRRVPGESGDGHSQPFVDMS